VISKFTQSDDARIFKEIFPDLQGHTEKDDSATLALALLSDDELKDELRRIAEEAQRTLDRKHESDSLIPLTEEKKNELNLEIAAVHRALGSDHAFSRLRDQADTASIFALPPTEGTFEAVFTNFDPYSQRDKAALASLDKLPDEKFKDVLESRRAEARHKLEAGGLPEEEKTKLEQEVVGIRKVLGDPGAFRELRADIHDITLMGHPPKADLQAVFADRDLRNAEDRNVLKAWAEDSDKSLRETIAYRAHDAERILKQGCEVDSYFKEIPLTSHRRLELRQELEADRQVLKDEGAFKNLRAEITRLAEPGGGLPPPPVRPHSPVAP
jgi:hypothetical protein